MRKYRNYLLFYIIITILLLRVSIYANENKLPKVAVVLSGGAARGIAHIGVISVLEEYNVPIDIIVGVSMGSIVGGYYAYGYTIDEMLSKARNFSLKSLIDFNNPKDGFLSGEKEQAIFNRDLDDAKIEELEIPLIIVSTNIDNGKVFIFDKGPLKIAMRASSAIPGVFDPVYYNGNRLVDGGVLNDVPIDIAKKMGADIVIVSNVSAFRTMNKSKIAKKISDFTLNYVSENREKFNFEEKLSNNNIISMLYKTLLLIEQNQKVNVKSNISDPDFLIKPLHNEIKPLNFYKVDEGYELGRKATLKIIDEIVARIYG